MKTKCLLYCTMAKPYLIKNPRNGINERNSKSNYFFDSKPIRSYGTAVNGTIVAECEVECEEIVNLGDQNIFETKTLDCLELLKKSCLYKEDLDKYLIKDYEDTKGYALHISNLKVFDEPLKLNELLTYNTKNVFKVSRVEKAPQNMMWVWYKGEKYCLISIRPQWVCKILNGEKTIEVRKKILKGML